MKSKEMLWWGLGIGVIGAIGIFGYLKLKSGASPDKTKPKALEEKGNDLEKKVDDLEKEEIRNRIPKDEDQNDEDQNDEDLNDDELDDEDLDI